MATPTYGFRTYKGKGSRLLPTLEEGDKRYANVQARDGYSGWKDGLMFIRAYAYQDGGDGSGHLYRVEAIRMRGLDSLAVGYGRTNGEAWSALYAALKTKGIMPENTAA